MKNRKKVNNRFPQKAEEAFSKWPGNDLIIQGNIKAQLSLHADLLQIQILFQPHDLLIEIDAFQLIVERIAHDVGQFFYQDGNVMISLSIAL